MLFLFALTAGAMLPLQAAFNARLEGVSMTAAAPRFGAATMIAAVICGQVIFSLILDRFGLFGLAVQPLPLRRVVAAGW